MIRETLTLSALIAAVLLVRAVFKNRVPKRMIYALWLVVLLKLCMPGSLFSLPVLPAEQTAAPVQRAEFPAQTAPVTQPPAQAVQPQTPAQPVTQEPENPAAKPLTATQIFRIIWFSGSACSASGCLARGWSLRSGCAKAGNSSEDTEKPVFTSQAASRRPALQASSRPSI